MGNNYANYNYVSGWKFADGIASTTGDAGVFKVLTGLDTLLLCPSIASATKKIEASYKFFFSSGFVPDYNLMCCSLDVSYQLFFIKLNSNKRLDIYLKSNNNASTIYQKINDLLLGKDTDYELKCELDIENSKFKVSVNDDLRVDTSVNISDLHLNKWVPCIGGEPNYTACYMKKGFNLYSSSFSYKIDGVEQIT